MSGLGEIALIRGLNYLSESQATIAHNLANVSSFGYKRRIPLAQPIGQDFNTIREGSYPTTRFTEFLDWSLGNPNPTGNKNHISIQAQQFLKVQADDGSTFFTRSGQLQLNEKSELVINNGYRVLNAEGQPIRITGARDGSGLAQMKISPAGVITDGLATEGTAEPVGRLALFEVPDPKRLQPAGNSLYRYPEIHRVRSTPTNAIVQGTLEQSNVQPTQELINMILAQRGFSASMKALTTLGRIKETFVTAVNR